MAEELGEEEDHSYRQQQLKSIWKQFYHRCELRGTGGPKVDRLTAQMYCPDMVMPSNNPNG